MTSTSSELRVGLGNQTSTNALKDGRVTIPGWTMKFTSHPNILTSVRNLCRGLEDLEVCEMPMATYLAAREAGLAFTAIPVFVLRQFPQSRIFTSVRSRVSRPADLKGGRVGVRAYTVTTAVWGRGVLSDSYGVEPDCVTWVAADEEHVGKYVRPLNVVSAQGRDLGEMLASGEIDATIAIRVPPSSMVRPLFADGRAEELAWYARTGVYPLNHTVVVKDSLLKADPSLPRLLYQAFVEARDLALRNLHTKGPSSDTDRDLYSWYPVMSERLLAYGLDANRKALAMLVRYCEEQHVVGRPAAIEELFVDVS